MDQETCSVFSSRAVTFGAVTSQAKGASSSTERLVKLGDAAKRTDRRDRLVSGVRFLRTLLPGDSRLGDPLSVTGDEVSTVLARRVAEAGAERASAARELGLGAIQVWQALSEASGRGHGERELAIVFADIVDFSPWALEAGDTAVLELLRGFAAAVDPVLKEHGGEVVKRLGDGVMAVFDDPQAAVEAARQACRVVGEIEVEGHRPQLRAGVHVGRPRKLGGDYIGVDVNIAARLAAAGKGGEVLVSEATRSHVDPESLGLRRLRRFKAKGAPQDLDVYVAEPA